MNSVRRTSLLCTLSAAVLGSALPSHVSAQVALHAVAPVSAVSSTLAPVSSAPISAVSATASSGVATRITEKVDDYRRTTLTGHVRPFLNKARDEGEVSGSTVANPMMLIFSRTTAQQANLDSTADALHNRNSPMFHKWLTPQQFGAAYSPADSDIAQVSAWLQSKGLKVLDIPPSKTFISFTGTVGQLKTAFGVSVHKFTINGETHAATVNEPQVPTALASVIGGIRGLDNFAARPMLRNPTLYKKNPATGKMIPVAGTSASPRADLTDSTGGYQVGPQDFYTIYNENPLLQQGITGAGQTVAVIEEALIAPADVASFRSVFGLPAYPSTPNATAGGLNMFTGSSTGLNGYASCYSPATLTAGKKSGEEGEATLDAQWAGAVAPNAIVDFVACGGTSKSADGTTLGALGIDHSAQYIVNYLQGSVIAASMSYGECEADMTNSTTSGAGYYNNQWQQFAVEGITPVVSSGDSGSAGCYQNKADETTLPPSSNGFGSSAWNVSAGGTDFGDTYETNNYTTAPATTWWNATNSAGLGSAISYVPETTWGGYCSNPLFVSYLQANASTSFGTTYTPAAVCNYAGTNSSVSGYLAVVGGSGGISTFTTIPSWQSVYGVGQNSTSTTYRNTPDVSLFAASGFWGHYLPYCESDEAACTSANYLAENQYLGAGGTSFVAPQLAGFFALVAQKTGTAQGQADYTLYSLASQQYGTTSAAGSQLTACSGSALAAGQTPPANCIFHDVSNDMPSLQGGSITAGIYEPCVLADANCYGVSGGTYGLTTVPGTTAANGTLAYNVGPGYDEATGLGSFNIANLVNGWNTVTPKFASATALSANNTAAGSTTPITFTATVTANGRGGNATPAGTVTFYNSSNQSIGTANVVRSCAGSGSAVACDGVATLNTTGAALTPSNSTYTASFSGDAANDAASSSSTISLMGPAAVSVVSPTLKSGTTAYITAYFSYPGLAAPTGTVTVLVNGSSANVSGLACTSKAAGTSGAHMNCTATYSGVGVAAGNYTLTVSAAADSNYATTTGIGFVTVTPGSVPAIAPKAPVSAVATAIAVKAMSVR